MRAVLLIAMATAAAETEVTIDEDFESGKAPRGLFVTTSGSRGAVLEGNGANGSRYCFRATSEAENVYIVIPRPFEAKGAWLSFDFRIDVRKYPDDYLAISPKTQDGKVYPLTAVHGPKPGRWHHYECVLDERVPALAGGKVLRILIRSHKLERAGQAEHSLSIDNLKLVVGKSPAKRAIARRRAAMPDFLSLASAAQWPPPSDPSRGDFELVRDGRPAATVVTDTTDDELMRAATELVEHVAIISGARPAIADHGDGPAARLAVDTRLPREGHRLVVTPSGATLIGHDAWAVELGVYELLRRLGVRWFMPGQLGRVAPRSKTVRLPAGRYEWTPRYTIRDQTGPFWSKELIAPDAAAEVRQWHRRMGAANSGIMSNHNYFHMFPERLLPKHPEYFAIVDDEATAAQIRTTSPEVIRIAAEKAAARFRAQPRLRSFSLMPNDNIQWDERDEATRLDGPSLEHPWLYGWPLSDVAPRLTAFLNSVAEAVTKEYPNRWLCTYVMYHRMQRPKPGMRVHPNAIIGLTLHDRNCVRPLADRSDKHNRYVLDTVKAWQALIPRGFVRTYFPPYRISSVVFRRPRGHIVDMQHLLAMERILGCKNEYADDCATHIPDEWIRSRWLLHPERAADELLLDFYANFYGAARGPMMAYHELCEWALEQATVVVMPGTRALGRMRDVYPREVERRMDEYLNLASQAVRRADAVQRDRVRLVTYGHEYLRQALAASDALLAYRPEQALDNVRSMRRIALEAWRFNKHAFQHNAQGKPFSPSLDWEERRLKRTLSTNSVGGAG